MMVLISLIMVIVFGTIVAIIARSKGRSGFGWFLYGVAIFPVALVHILVARHADEGDTIKCPMCAETVRAEAKVCRFCGHKLPARRHADEADDEPVSLAGLPPELAMKYLQQGSGSRGTAAKKTRR